MTSGAFREISHGDLGWIFRRRIDAKWNGTAVRANFYRTSLFDAPAMRNAEPR